MVTPFSGNVSSQTISFTFSDSNGWSSLAVVDVLINSFLDGANACYFAFVPIPTNSSAGYLYLVDDAGNGGYVSGTPMPLPTSSSLQNSQCTISGAGSSVSASGNTLTLNLAITFKPAFAGNQVVYAAAREAVANSEWQALGAWTVLTPPPTVPAAVSVSPGRGPFQTIFTPGGGAQMTFTFTDPNGWNFGGSTVFDVLINSYLDGVAACYFAFLFQTALPAAISTSWMMPATAATSADRRCTSLQAAA